LRFTFDASRSPGSRVVDVTVNGQPLDEKKKYTLATTNFLAIDGGDGYAMLKGLRLLISPDQAQSDFDILRQAVTAAKSIAPTLDGRIQRLDKSQGKKSDCADTN
jgi:5'-nucleotidase